MGLLLGRGAGGVERRAVDAQPELPTNGQAGTFSIRKVDLSRTDSALQKVAVFASVNLLANIVRMLPGKVYLGEGRDRRQLATPKWLTDLGGSGHGTGDFLWQLVYCLGLRGNVAGTVVDRDPMTAQPRTIALQHPDAVAAWKDPKSGLPTWRFSGTEVPREDVWHRRLYPTPGNVLGLSPIAVHALTIGLGLSSAQFGAQWFLDGAHPSSVLTNPNARMDDVSQSAAEVVKKRFVESIRGKREPVVLGGGWEWKQVQINPAESQFLETQKYTAAECARIFGPGMPEMLGYESGGSLTYTNQEQRSVDLLTYTTDPWLTFVEETITALLPARQWFRFERKALLRTDTLTRFQVHQIALRNRMETVNEVRDLEELPPVSWGDAPPEAAPEPVPVSMES